MMRIVFFVFLFTGIAMNVIGQKLEKFEFNLYTDSLKKGYYNYINVDGLFSDGTWLPLDTMHIRFSSTGGRFKGNDLFIDSSFVTDSVVVFAKDRSHQLEPEQVVIYIRKRGFNEPLPTENEVLRKQTALFEESLFLKPRQASHLR